MPLALRNGNVHVVFSDLSLNAIGKPMMYISLVTRSHIFIIK